MSKQCKNCGTDLPEDASFCPRCAQSQIERRAIKPPRLWRKKALIPAGGVLVLAAGVALWRYHRVAVKQFGGITGDLAGWFLQKAELYMLAALVFCQWKGFL